jgi:hypothetical protein
MKTMATGTMMKRDRMAILLLISIEFVAGTVA